jgi:hypothetical protein
MSSWSLGKALGMLAESSEKALGVVLGGALGRALKALGSSGRGSGVSGRTLGGALGVLGLQRCLGRSIFIKWHNSKTECKSSRFCF